MLAEKNNKLQVQDRYFQTNLKDHHYFQEHHQVEVYLEIQINQQMHLLEVFLEINNSLIMLLLEAYSGIFSLNQNQKKQQNLHSCSQEVFFRLQLNKKNKRNQ